MARRAANRRPKIQQRSMPAPFGGWNTRDAVDAMPPTDAFEMTNWIPDTGNVRTRDGHSEHAWLAEETITFGNAATGSATSATSATASHTMQSGSSRGLVAVVAAEGIGSTVPSSVTYDPTGDDLDMTRIAFAVQDNTGISLWFLPADDLATAGSRDIVATFSSNKSGIGIRTEMLLGVRQSTTMDATQTDTINAGTPLRSALVVAANTLQYEACTASVSTVTFAQVGDQDAERAEIAVSTVLSYNVATNLAGAAGTVNMNTDLSASADGAQAVMSIRPAIDATLGNIETIMEYDGGGTTKMLASTTTNIYDVTSAGVATSLLGSLTDGRWDFAMFNNDMGLVNGSDAPQVYDGTSISAMTVSGSGLTVSDLTWINVFKNFSFFGTGDGNFWYSDVNVLGGTLEQFPLSRVSKRGGACIGMENLSVTGSAGDNIEDLACFFFDNGEVIIYRGTDPGAASTWSLAGVYRIGRVIGDNRSIRRVDGDIYVITDQDYVSVSEAIKKSGRVRPSKLSGAAKDVTTRHALNTGWEFVYVPKEQLLWVNVPITTTTYNQHVLNLETGGATKFEGFNARSWGLLDGDAYFGTTDGRVMKALDGLTDDGSNIVAACQQSWDALGYQGDKAITGIRPVLSAQGAVLFGLGFSMDYRTAQVDTVTSTPAAGTPWGSAWGSPWSPATDIRDNWFIGNGYGRKVGTRITISTQNQTFAWFRTDFEYEPVL